MAGLEVRIGAAASDFAALNSLMEEKQQKEEALENKMERWMYLNDLAEQIAAGRERQDI